MQKRERVQLTDVQKNELQRNMNLCWDTIALDLLNDVDGHVMPKDEVVDVVIDQMEGNGGMTKEMKKIWNSMPFEQMQEIANETFKYERYGI